MKPLDEMDKRREKAPEFRGNNPLYNSTLDLTQIKINQDHERMSTAIKYLLGAYPEDSRAHTNVALILEGK